MAALPPPPPPLHPPPRAAPGRRAPIIFSRQSFHFASNMKSNMDRFLQKIIGVWFGCEQQCAFTEMILEVGVGMSCTMFWPPWGNNRVLIILGARNSAHSFKWYLKRASVWGVRCMGFLKKILGSWCLRVRGTPRFRRNEIWSGLRVENKMHGRLQKAMGFWCLRVRGTAHTRRKAT